MFKKAAIIHWTCSLALLGYAALPCFGQHLKSGAASTPARSGNSNPAVNPNTATVMPSINPFNPVNPFAPSGFRGFGLGMPMLSGPGYAMNGFAANQMATSSIIASVTNSPFINQMQQGMLPGGVMANPWASPSAFMNPMMMMNNPMMMNNSFMNPMMMNSPFMNPMMMNNPFMNPMMMNPMTANPFMNPMMMNPMAGNPFMNPMMTNPMMNPMMMNGGFVSPFMMQPGLFGPMNMPVNPNFGQPGVFGAGL
jgi:hypothetical protein